MVIDVAMFMTWWPVVLPVLAIVLAGILRQDRLPDAANEAITWGIVLVLAIVQALYNKALTNNILLDFVVVAGYAVAVAQTSPMQALQGYLQSNVLAFAKGISALPTGPDPMPVPYPEPQPIVLPTPQPVVQPVPVQNPQNSLSGPPKQTGRGG